MQAYLRARSLEHGPALVEGFDSAPYNEPRGSSRALSPPDRRCKWLWAENWGTSDQAIPGNDRHRLQIMVSAAAGLREVRVYDNAQLWQRFCRRASRLS